MLRRDDSIGIVAYGTDARVVLEPTPVRDSEAILSAVEALQPGGSTNAAAGLELGYEMARGSFVPGGVNRVVIASDGVANVGPTDADTILGHIRDGTETGIQLVAIGVGMGNFNDVLLERLADDGDGFYAYVDDIDEARRVFVSDLTGTLQSVALDARAQVDFDRDNVEAYRLVGYENRAIADDQYRNDGASTPGRSARATRSRRCTRSGSPARTAPASAIATVGLRWIDPSTSRPAELAQDVRLADLASTFGAHAGDVQARRARRRDRRAVPGQPVGRHLPPEGRAGGRRRAGERAAEDRGGPRLPAICSRRRPPSNADRGAPVRGASRDESSLSAGVVEERRRPTPVLGPRRRATAATFLDRLALGPVVRHGVRARREGAVATLGVGFAGQQLPGTAGQDAPDRAVVGPGELDDDRPHLRVVGPRAVDHVGRPEDRLAGRDPPPLVADAAPSRRPR